MIIAFENKYSNIIMRECKIVQGQSSTNTHTQNATEKQNNNKSVLEPVEHQKQTAAAQRKNNTKASSNCLTHKWEIE